MVGAPKHLHDLNRMGADVRVTCRACGFEVDWTVADLSKHLIAIRGNLAWSEITRFLVCRRQGCGSNRLRATPVVASRNTANLDRRVGKLDAQLVGAAMEILEHATAASPGRDVTTVAVRLALLVAFAYGRDGAAVRVFWSRAGNAGRVAAEGLHEPLALIRHRLIEHGCLAERPLPEQVKTWPWNSPAPPGWRSATASDPDEG